MGPGRTLRLFARDRLCAKQGHSSKSISHPDLNGLYALMLEDKKFEDLPSAGAMRLNSLSYNGMALKGGRASIELLMRMRDAGNTASEMLAALRRP